MNEDFQKMMEKRASKTLEKVKKALEEANGFRETLFNDYRLSKKTSEAQPKNQFLRRIRIRSYCAMVETQIHDWKWLVKSFHHCLETVLSDGEVSILNEETYGLDKRGDVVPRPQYFSMAENFIFSSRMYAKAFCCSQQIDFSKEGWICVKEVFKVRDRLMHPKFAKGVKVGDEEIVRLDLAEKWFFDETRALFGGVDLSKVIQSRVLKRSTELN